MQETFAHENSVSLFGSVVMQTVDVPFYFLSLKILKVHAWSEE
jgi:hypothetical protein